MCILLQLLDETPSLDQQPGPSQPAEDGNETIRITRAELHAMVNKAVSDALNEDDTSEDTVSEETLLDVSVSTSAAISDALATTIRVRMTERMSEEVLDKKRELYKTVPSNLSESLVATRVNPELWSAIPNHAKSKDKR